MVMFVGNCENGGRADDTSRKYSRFQISCSEAPSKFKHLKIPSLKCPIGQQNRTGVWGDITLFVFVRDIDFVYRAGMEGRYIATAAKKRLTVLGL
jgi:hypothetical protein